tara:strand:+ start:9171 stop:10178 length:1008 start_codon:yes stop_codon:yes gene_type:complete
MKNIFITGGAGFIGSHLVEALVKSGHKVKTLVRYNKENSIGWLSNANKDIKNEVEILFGDINDPFLIEKNTKKIDIIYNLAALISIPYSYESPSEYVRTNINGTLNCLEAAKKNNVQQFIQTSTSEVYGTAQQKKISETHPLNAQSPYAATKIASDQLTLSYFKSFNLPATVIRPFNTFGPRQSMRAVLPNILMQIAKSKKNPVDVILGNVNSRRDFVYVSDTVNGFMKCINNKKINGEVINLGTGTQFSILEVVNILRKILDKKIRIITDKKRVRPKKSEVDILIANNTKAKKLLNWRPNFSGKKGFELAILKSLEWFNENKDSSKYDIKRYNK